MSNGPEGKGDGFLFKVAQLLGTQVLRLLLLQLCQLQKNVV